jgi:ABC-type Fe3+/spermidine/putrescine transport system ATPase subunit
MLSVEAVEKKFDDEAVLRGVSLTVAPGEIVALLGPSGSGKTTLLRIIAGLESADHGRLQLHGRDLATIPVHRRGFGFVFQDFALFPHKNVADNVAFGLRMMQWPAAQISRRVAEVLALVRLSSPSLLLLDEPLGSLDRTLRERLMLDLRAILKQQLPVNNQSPGTDNQLPTPTTQPSPPTPESTSITAIYVTHDQAEAFAIADRVLVMNDGRIEQAGTPVELYRWPATPFVARFLGMENLFQGEMVARQPPTVRTGLGDLAVAGGPAELPPPGSRVTVLIRPGAARVAANAAAPQTNLVPGRVVDTSFRGRYQVATVAVKPDRTAGAGDEWLLRLEFDSGVRLPAPGQPVKLSLDPARVLVLTSG